MIKNVARMSSLVLTGALILAACTPAAPKPEVASIVLTPDAPKITVGGTQPFTAVAKDKDGKTISGVSFTYTSSDTSKATINGAGVATGVAVGTSNITAKAGSKTSNAVTLTVEASPVTSIQVSAPAATVEEGKTLAFTAVSKDKDGQVVADANVQWISDNAAVATVDANGLLTAVKAGTVNISAKLGDVTSNTVAVTVTPKPTSTVFDFEADAQGWGPVTAGTATAMSSADYATSGTKSLKLTISAEGWMGADFAELKDFSGKTKIVYDIKTTDAATNTMTFVLKEGDTGRWCETKPDSWLEAGKTQTVTLDVTVNFQCYDPAETRKVNLSQIKGFYLYMKAGTFYIDNVRFE